MALIKSTGSSVALVRISLAFSPPKWLKRHYLPFPIWSPRLKALSFSKNPLTYLVHPQLLSQPPITVNLAQLSKTCLAINQVATHLPTVVMTVPTPGRAAVRHAAKSAARKGTTLISATIDMHEVENLLAPQPTLPRPLKPSALLMGSSPMTGTWTQGLRPT
ncbi:hypothetical protein PVL29_001402 [Vitis rotundifolia]|uniref:Uncharacterized protein n=1 Tax=Vitis rotundifolia TaxID=103349 RepID=A0AA39E6D4_VITRO|nr:hypothetical protein PVL29_001402 [Vitis rotundifolia]